MRLEVRGLRAYYYRVPINSKSLKGGNPTKRVLHRKSPSPNKKEDYQLLGPSQSLKMVKSLIGERRSSHLGVNSYSHYGCLLKEKN